VIGVSSSVQQHPHVLISYVSMIMGIAITALISFAVLKAATRLHAVLGATGMNAVARLMGFLLICIGVQFVINGVLDITRTFSAA
jgi:multiple antibiotic resistance protein